MRRTMVLRERKENEKLRRLVAENNGFVDWLKNDTSCPSKDIIVVDATKENLIQAILWNTNAKTTLGLLQNTNVEDLLWEARKLNLILGY